MVDTKGHTKSVIMTTDLLHLKYIVTWKMIHSILILLSMYVHSQLYKSTYCMVGNFCGVQIFVNSVGLLTHEKLLNFSYITK